MPKTRSTTGAPRKEGFNRSNHSMNPERLTGSLKVANPRTKGISYLLFFLILPALSKILRCRNHQTPPDVQEFQSEARSQR